MTATDTKPIPLGAFKTRPGQRCPHCGNPLVCKGDPALLECAECGRLRPDCALTERDR